MKFSMFFEDEIILPITENGIKILIEIIEESFTI